MENIGMTLKNFTLNAYTADTWTDLAKADAKITTIIIANPSASAINASLRIADTSTIERAVLVPPISIAAGDSQQLPIGALNLGSNDRLQFKGSAVGLHVTASGETPT